MQKPEKLELLPFTYGLDELGEYALVEGWFKYALAGLKGQTDPQDRVAMFLTSEES